MGVSLIFIPFRKYCRQGDRVALFRPLRRCRLIAECGAYVQDEYSIMGSKHFIGIHGYMLVYSVASRQSFETVRVIIDKILNHLVGRPNAVVTEPGPCAHRS